MQMLTSAKIDVFMDDLFCLDLPHLTEMEEAAVYNLRRMARMWS
jgi:hypothetical protein